MEVVWWVTPGIVVVALGELFSLGPIGHGLGMTVFVCGLAAGSWAAMRVLGLHNQRMRTPMDQSWAQSVAGSMVLHAIQRVTLNELTSLTPKRFILADLKFTDRDVFQLLEILSNDHGVDRRALDALAGEPDFTVEMVIEVCSGAATEPFA
ncbi:MAG: hypothetical protein ACK53I_04745 [Phenylobacterium sp.]|jgi:hypothetical protein